MAFFFYQKMLYFNKGSDKMNNFEKIVKKLIKDKKTISTMESCTGGYLASEITCINNSSDVFKYGAVTYSNEYKEKMGVPKETIDTYTVYSIETAKDMAKAITDFTNSNYGVGVTGQINKQDDDNPYGEVGEVFISIYDRDEDKYYEYDIKTHKRTRKENKEAIVAFISEKMLEVLNIDNK